METIAHIGLQPDTLGLIQRHAAKLGVELRAIQETELEQALSQTDLYEAMLIGEKTQNPISVVQEVYRKDKNLSVLVVADGANLPKLKQALQFSPFIGPTVRSTSSEVGESLISVLDDVRQRTHQRRSYAKTKQAALPITDFSGDLFDQIKADYMGRVLEEAPIGALLLNQNGQVLTANPFALRLFGRGEHEVINRPLIQLFPEHLQESLQQFLLQGYQAGAKREFPLGSNEQEKYLEVSLASVSKESRRSYLICIINDITHVVQAQKLTEAHLREVEAINADLQRTNSDLDTFVYAASHDLKSPILNIQGLVDMLEQELEEPSEDVQMALSLIRTAVERFKQTLADMSEVIRSQKELYNEVATLHVAEIVEEVKSSIETDIKKAGAEIVVDTAELPCITTSKSNLKSILYNLISNSIKYRSPDRLPHILIKTAPKQAGYVSLSVTDNGLGIPKEKQSEVFAMFKRLHAHVEGTGMGLHIVKRIVDKEGGKIEIRSEVGKGTTFEILLKQ